MFAGVFQLGNPAEKFNLSIHVKYEPINPFSVSKVSIGLDKRTCQVEGPRLVEATVTGPLSDLAELGCQSVYDLTQSCQLKRLRGNTKDVVMHIKKLLFS